VKREARFSFGRAIMINLMRRRPASVTLRILSGVLIGVALASSIFAQAPRQLKVEVEPNQRVWILASDVSYGEVLRALQGKLGWEIEIPVLADELKLSYINVEAKQPQDALAKLLEGSGLGYAFSGGANGSRILKVIVISSTSGEAGLTQDAVSSAPIPDNAQAGASLSLPTQAQVATTSDGSEKSSKKSLSDAINAIGAPPGVSPSDVGRKTTFSISNAAGMMGVPPGVSPSDVGRMTTLQISDAAKIMGVPPGVSPGDVGKTVTLPLPTGPGQHP
jgi:hypothetical protein